MKPPPNQAVRAGPDARAERRAMTAVIAAFALLVQMLVTTPVMAMVQGGPQKSHGETVAICTSHGLQTVDVGDGGSPQDDPGGSCGHCVCPPVAAPAMPLPLGLAPRFAYAADRPLGPTTSPPPPARGPPRPHGQGPPAPNA